MFYATFTGKLQGHAPAVIARDTALDQSEVASEKTREKIDLISSEQSQDTLGALSS